MSMYRFGMPPDIDKRSLDREKTTLFAGPYGFLETKFVCGRTDNVRWCSFTSQISRRLILIGSCPGLGWWHYPAVGVFSSQFSSESIQVSSNALFFILNAFFIHSCTVRQKNIFRNHENENYVRITEYPLRMRRKIVWNLGKDSLRILQKFL